ncbi:MAG: hypothetical protein PHD01_10155 [Geobacteraceae bacterium]|nr:hypothetical protein [Geobacteraceae bacterium]
MKNGRYLSKKMMERMGDDFAHFASTEQIRHEHHYGKHLSDLAPNQAGDEDTCRIQALQGNGTEVRLLS